MSIGYLPSIRYFRLDITNLLSLALAG